MCRGLGMRKGLEKCKEFEQCKVREERRGDAAILVQ